MCGGPERVLTLAARKWVLDVIGLRVVVELRLSLLLSLLLWHESVRARLKLSSRWSREGIISLSLRSKRFACWNKGGGVLRAAEIDILLGGSVILILASVVLILVG